MLKKLKERESQGFTLIEIVLVLAIAGLIMVIVFLAVSGAQKSRRDTQRKNDAARILAAVESYASNNNGNYPQVATGNPTSFDQVIPAFVNNPKDPLTNANYTYVGVVTPGAGTSAGIGYTRPGGVATVCIGLEQGTQACFHN